MLHTATTTDYTVVAVPLLDATTAQWDKLGYLTANLVPPTTWTHLSEVWDNLTPLAWNGVALNADAPALVGAVQKIMGVSP